MALSREERIRRARAAFLGTTRSSARSAPAPRREPARQQTFADRQANTWGKKAGRAWANFDEKRAVTAGAATIAAGGFVSRRLQTGGKIFPFFPAVSKQTGGRPNKATGKTTGTEYVGRTRDLAGQEPPLRQATAAGRERLPKQVRRATTPMRRAYRNVDMASVVKSAKREVQRRRPVKKTAPTRAGSQATNTRSLRGPTPYTPPDRVGIVQRASEGITGGRTAPSFGSVSDSPMKQGGMLRIPRAGTRLSGIVSRSPNLPEIGDSKPAPRRRSPKSSKSSKSKVSMPKAPTAETPPKPQTAKATATQKPPAPAKTKTVKQPPSPPHTYSKPVTEAKKVTGPRLVASSAELGIKYPGGETIEIRQHGPRDFDIHHRESGRSVRLPQSPTRASATPDPKTGQMTWSQRPGGKKRAKAVLESLRPKARTNPAIRALTDYEKARAKRLGISESKLRQSLLADYKQNPFDRAMGERPSSTQGAKETSPTERAIKKIERGRTDNQRKSSGGAQIRLARGLGLMGSIPAIISLARGNSLGSLAGPMSDRFRKGAKPEDYYF